MPPCSPSLTSEQLEIHFDVSHHCDWFAVLRARFEAPLINSLNCLFIQSESQSFDDANILRHAVGSDFEIKDHGSRVLRDPGFFGVLRVRFGENLRGCHTTTDLEDVRAALDR